MHCTFSVPLFRHREGQRDSFLRCKVQARDDRIPYFQERHSCEREKADKLQWSFGAISSCEYLKMIEKTGGTEQTLAPMTRPMQT